MFFKKDNDKTAATSRALPALPLRDIIVFPHMVCQLFVGREKSIAALDEAMARDKEILLAAQKSAKTNEPRPRGHLPPSAPSAPSMQLLRLPDGTVKVLVEGKRRARIQRFADGQRLLRRRGRGDHRGARDRTVEVEALIRTMQEHLRGLRQAQQADPARDADERPDHRRPREARRHHRRQPLHLKLADKQAILETEDPKTRLEKLYELMQAEIEILQVEKKIRSRVKKQMEKTQKEYYLNEQMQAIQKELGGGERDEFKSEIQEIEEKLKSKKMSEEAQQKVKKELKKLKMMHPTSAEATVVRNYIDWILGLPWYDKSEENYDLTKAEEILDEDHYGLKKIKERILEYLAVHGLVEKLPGPDPLHGGTPRRGQDLARPLRRTRHGSQVRAPLARWRARRGRDPRPPPHLHRRAARQDHPEPEEGRHQQPGLPARRDRQDEHRLPRRPRPRRCSRCSTPNRTAPSTTTTSTSTTTSPRSCSSPPPTTATRSRCPCRTAWRSSSSRATPSSRSSTSL